MSKFLNTTTRTVLWFKKSNDTSELQMSPPFQRNPVWTTPQKSYLIDSILNGFPVPEIYMQELISDEGDEQHVVIDGQQRIRACLEFIEGKYAIVGEDSPKWGSMFFDDLTVEDKKRFFSYTFIVRQLPEMSDQDIRGIFQRLNRNVVALNSQELRHATYWGSFITTIQEIADYPYWSSIGVFSPLNIRRMMDIEFISEIAVAILHGHQNKKETLDQFYADYEESFDEKDELIKTFQTVVFELEQLYPDIKNTRWRKKSDFYSLFVYFASKITDLPLARDARQAVRQTLDCFSHEVDRALRVKDLEKECENVLVKEYANSIRASSDVGNRRRRHHALEVALESAFKPTTENVKPHEIKPMQEGLYHLVDDDELFN